MVSLVNYIVKKYVPKGENPELPAFRNDIGVAQGWISIFANFHVVKIGRQFAYAEVPGSA